MNSRKTMINLYNVFKGRRTFYYLQKFEKTQYLSLEQIESLQMKKAKNLIKYAYNYVPYYKKIFKSLKLTPDDIQNKNDFEKLPVLTKEDIRNNISEMVSINYKKSDLIVNSTGGSTGENLNFFNDKNRSEIRQAISIRGDKWAGLDIGVKHTYLWGSRFDSSLQNTFKEKLINKLYGSLFLSSYELSDKKMLQYAYKLQKHNSKVLIAYPSSLYELSKFINENKLDKINLESIITSAETLYDYQREYIESTFNCKIFNRYGCREFGPIAQECSEHIGLHVNLEHLLIEFLENNDSESTNGDGRSKIIITDLDNYAMPLIRYEIGDIGESLDHSCHCGRNLPLMLVEGRTFDVIIGKNGNKLGGTFWTLLFRTYVEGVKEFQIIQESKDKLNIALIINKNFNSESLTILEIKIKEFCGNSMKIHFLFPNKIDASKSGKRRFVINRCQDGN